MAWAKSSQLLSVSRFRQPQSMILLSNSKPLEKQSVRAPFCGKPPGVNPERWEHSPTVTGFGSESMRAARPA